MKDRLWPAGIAALAMHGLMIAAMAFGVIYPQGTSLQDFQAEVMFVSELEKGTVVASPSPATPLRLCADLSHSPRYSHSPGKGRGKQPVKENFGSTLSVGGYPSGEKSDAFPIFNPPPIYPYEAKRKRIQGVVLVRLQLTDTGIVDKAITLPPRIDPLLEDAALSAVHAWRFKPGARTVEVPIEFKLET